MPGSDESASSSRSQHCQHHNHSHHQDNNHPPLFRFPKLPTSSPDSGAMTSESNRLEPPGNSLSESWATLSGSDIYSEDDSRSDQTDTASLVGRGVPDDVTSLEGRDDDDSEVDSVDVRSCYSETSLPPFPPHMREQSLENSDTTIKAPYQLGSDPIEFVEPDNWSERETVELKHTIKVLNAAEIPAFLRTLSHDLGDGHLSVTVQQTVAKRGLDLAKPFRTLYTGDSDFKHIVLDKLGDVLVAGSEDGFNNGESGNASRFHVVPASFGTCASPNYAELLPIHVQLVVDECLSATAQSKQSKISITLNNQTLCSSAWTGSGYEIQSSTPWTLPDLAIFFIAQDDNLGSHKIRSLCHTFMKRHGVPSIVISENPMWAKQNPIVPLDDQSLHVCLESRRKGTGEPQVLGRFPIDLKTFESIAPGQLNRHIASLSSPCSSKTIPKATKAPDKTTGNPDQVRGWRLWVDIKPLSDGSHQLILFGTPYNIGTIRNAFFSFGILASGFLVIAVISALMHAFILLIMNLSSRAPTLSMPPLHAGPASTTAYLPPITTTASTAKTTSLMPLSARDLISSDCALEDSLHLDTYISKITSGTEEPGNGRDKFQVHVIGDCHIIIKLPARLASRRKSFKFDVRVTRDVLHIPFDQTRLFDGVYKLRLPREDAYGLLNISIVTKSKPMIEQVTEIDFGTPWLKIANWKRAAQKLSAKLRRDLNLASVGLSDAYNRMSADLQEMSDILRGETESVGRASLQRAMKATSSMLAKSKQLSDEIARRTQDKMLASTTLLREKLSTVNTDVVQLANDGLCAIEKEARRLFQNPASAYDFNIARHLTDNAQRVRRSPGMAAVQKQAAHLWRRLGTRPNNELRKAMRWSRCERGRCKKAQRGKAQD
ncbi:hypothetical protein I7I53_03158 [Histoplasma capsulatum var. duboisii H88]|uniref:Uncharacterized protein n=2 Tax=Ajellomyces capsulatus (strain H88) TaxID=544711 RepID=A0A8A1LLV7_AJEC8|nr:hypothetical protein I7I53_03158 [Histoplasma capsulatum var. duboisii H88]